MDTLQEPTNTTQQLTSPTSARHLRRSRQPRHPKLRRRRHPFTIITTLSLLGLIAIALNQEGVLSFLWSQALALLPISTIAGTVNDGQTGAPVRQVTLSFSALGYAAQTTTNDQGRFSLRAPALHQMLLAVPTYEAQTITPGPDLLLTPAPDPSETARRFLAAFLQRDYHLLWSMLHLDAQALWGHETALADFLTAKFGSLSVRSFGLGAPKLARAWLDPHTTSTYTSLVLISASLSIAPSSGILTPASAQVVMGGLFTHLPLVEVQADGLWRVLQAGPLDPDAPLVIPASAPTLQAQVPILMYHHVSPLPTQNTLDFNLTVTQADFEQQMDYLADNGYHPITLTALFNHLYYQMTLPSHPIVLTFDDGYEDNYLYAFPILKAHHFVAEINIITGMIWVRYLTWEQIRAMAAWGFEMGSHTIHHIDLAAVLPATAEQELLDSKAALEGELGQPIQFFCYPSGEPFHHGTLENQQFITTLLAQDGYVGALLDPPPASTLQDPAHPYQLNRIRVSGGEALTEFINTLVNLGA
jgi:peptidoglycan/xylan/chitin deacetylase (PgdA/CDA1 family)